MIYSLPGFIFVLFLTVGLVACFPLNALDPSTGDSGPPPTPAALAEHITPSVLPSETPVPSVTPVPTATPLPDELAELAAAQRWPNDRVLLARLLTGQHDAPTVARTVPLDVQVGHVKQFWVNSIVDSSNYSVTAELRYMGSIVLMYVEQGTLVDQGALEAAAQAFEQQIYPRTRTLFGSEWQPGVDGDTRIVILNVQTIGGSVIGYFSPRDSVPRSVNRFSNEHEMFYMNVGAAQPGSTAYLDTLSHEFQHMIHWNEQRRSSTWFNEGCSTLAEDLNGYINQQFANVYLSNPDTQLTTWSGMPAESIAHYGAANLFMRYMYTQYAGDQGLIDLIRADAGNELDAFARLASRKRPDIRDFGDVYVDWAIANLLNNTQVVDGRYAYPPLQGGATLLPATVRPIPLAVGTTSQRVSQFGADYFALPPGPVTFTLAVSTSVPLASTRPQGNYAWWSGRGDNSVATLTRAFDLRGVAAARLRFATWYELEQGYDYAFVSVSTDGGKSWQTLPGQHTTSEDPHGGNYGYGLTGISGLSGQATGDGEHGTWVEETMDLAAFVGQRVLVRFWQVSDEGFNAPGVLIDDIRITELNYRDDAEAGSNDWQAEGFARIDGDVPQHWQVRLVRTATNGDISVAHMPLDGMGQGGAALAAGERGVLVVTATTPYTTEPAQYVLRVE